MAEAEGAVRRLSGPSRVSRVFQIADIHLRRGEGEGSWRRREYRAVLEALVGELRADPCVQEGEAVLVVCGDVFHHKELDNASHAAFNEFFREVAGVVPVLVIDGNHDIYTERADRMGSLESVMSSYVSEGNPVHYLKETGLYMVGDVGFGVTAVRDTLQRSTATCVRENLPRFPPAAALRGAGAKRAVALFHGTVRPGVTVAREREYPLSWFAGYDVAMFGDWHVQEVYGAEAGLPAWGYPGSLVQQNFGEALRGHGYIRWEMESCEARAVHVANPLGFVTYSADDDKVWLGSSGAAERVSPEEAMESSDFPREARVRVLSRRSYAEAEELERAARGRLEALGMRPCDVRYFCAKAVPVATGRADPSSDEEVRALVDLRTPESWERHLRGLEPERYEELSAAGLVGGGAAAVRALFVESPREDEVSFGGPLAKEVLAANEGLDKAASEFEKELASGGVEAGGTEETEILHLRWQWLMSYRSGYFDFSRATGKVVLLSGQNASGKSALLDILWLALFGESTPMRKDMCGVPGSSFINSGAPVKVASRRRSESDLPMVVLRLRCGGKEYEVTRSFVDQKDGSRRAEAEMREIGSGEPPTKKTKPVNDWVWRHVGSPASLLTGCVMTQTDSANFFRMSPAERRGLLVTALRLQPFALYAAALDVSAKAHRKVLKVVDGMLAGLSAGSDDVLPPPSVLPERLGSAIATREALEADLRALLPSLGGADPDCAATWDASDVDLAMYEGVSDVEVEAAAGALPVLRRARDEAAALLASLAPHSGGYEVIAGDEDREPEAAAVSLKYIAEREAEHAAWVEERRRLWGPEEDGWSAEECEARLREARSEAEAARAALAGWISEDFGESDPAISARDFPAMREALRAAEARRPRGEEVGGEEERAARAAVEEYDEWARHVDPRWLSDPDAAAMELADLAARAARAAECPPPAAWAVSRKTFDEEPSETGTIERLRAAVEEAEGAAEPERPWGDPERRASWLASIAGKNERDKMRGSAEEARARYWAIREGRRDMAALAERVRFLDSEAARLPRNRSHKSCKACAEMGHEARRAALMAETEDCERRLAELREKAEALGEGGGALDEADAESDALNASERAAEYERMRPEIEAWERSRVAWERREALREAAAALWGPLWRAGRRAAADLRARTDLAAAFVSEASVRRAIRDKAAATLESAAEWERWRADVREARRAAEGAAAAARRELAVADLRAAAAEKRAESAKERDRRVSEIAELERARGAAERRAAWEARRAAREMRSLDDDIARAGRAREAGEARAAARRARQARAAKEYLRISALLAEARAEEREAAAVSAVASDGSRRAAAVNRKRAGLLGYRSRVTRKLELLDRMLLRLAPRKTTAGGAAVAEEGYEAWVFRAVVLPLVEREMNDLIAGAGNENLRVRFRMTPAGPDAEIRDYNEDASRGISMGSGYQKQLVSFAMRLTLMRLGAVAGGCRVRHMIIDEGFVGSDSQNVRKSGDLVRYVMAAVRLDSAILISHLEGVRDCADEVVEVVRASCRAPSTLQYGQPRRYPI